MLSDKYKLWLTTSTRAYYFPCLHVILVYQMRTHTHSHISDTWGRLEYSHISDITGFLWYKRCYSQCWAIYYKKEALVQRISEIYEKGKKRS